MHPPFRLNGQSNQSPSGSTTAWINDIPCPRQAQMPRQEQMLNLCAQGSPEAAAVQGPALGRCAEVTPREPAGHTGPSSSLCSPQPLALSLPQLLQARTELSVQGELAAHQLLESGYLGLQEYGCQSKRRGRKARFSLGSECVCLSGQWETGRSLFPWLLSCYKSLVW